MTSLSVQPSSPPAVTWKRLSKKLFQMATGVMARACSKCAEEHVPPMIDDLCACAKQGDDGVVPPNEQLQNMVALWP